MTQANIWEQKLLGPTVFVPKVLTQHVTQNAAALLQQLHYSLQNSNFTEYGERWVCRSLETWAEILGCSARTIQRAFESLESLGLVISDRLHQHRYNQIKSYRVDYGVLATYLDKETNCLSVSGQTVVPEVDNLSSSNNKILNTDFKKQQTEKVREQDKSIPTHHPVSQIDKEEIVVDPVQGCKRGSGESLEKPQKPVKKKVELEPELEQEIVKSVGHKLSYGLKMLVAQASNAVIQDALTILRTAKNVKNKAGLFRQAIKEQWKPSAAAKDEKKFTLDPDFDEWWNYAKQLGLVIGSELKGDEFWIYTAPTGQPQLYAEIRSIFPINWLKRQLRQENS